MQLRIATLMLLLSFTTAFAGDDREQTYLMNFDLIITRSDDGSENSRIQQVGVRFAPSKPFHGNDLGEFDYFLTISELEDNEGKLTIEVYQFETRNKNSDVLSEIVVDVDFTLASPARFEGQSDTFGVDLAFSIDGIGH